MNYSARICPAVIAALLLLATDAIAQPVFINEIPIPPIVDAASGTINLEMRQSAHKFNPANASDSLNGGTSQPNGIPTYVYNVAGDSTMTILGPTLRFRTFGVTNIKVKNLLPQSTTTHWHGAEVPADMDGGPHQEIDTGATWNVSFTTLDSASTMWYHPHFHNQTLEQVQLGLSGLIIVEQPGDPIGPTLPRTYGADDIPVVMGDLGFAKGSDRASGMYIDTAKGKRPTNLVNGVTNPYVEVPAHMVRLRVLNGSTRKGVYFGVSTSYNAPFSTLQPFYLVAGDGGYTMKPDTLTRLLSGPGMRHEIVVDLSSYQPGQTLYLANLKDSLPGSIVGSPVKSPNGGGQDTTAGTAFLELRIVTDSAIRAKHPDYTVPVTSFTPFTTTWSPGLADTSNVVNHRVKLLVMTTDTINGKPENMFTIDSLTYDMDVINDTVCVNTKEIWTIRNLSTVAHPFHIHKIQFRVLDVVDANGDTVNLETYGLNSPKDDVLLLPGWSLRFLGQFDDYPSMPEPMYSYMYHCHILTHEDSIGGGMMHQFVVVDCISSSVEKAESASSAMSLTANEGALRLKGASDAPSTLALVDLRGRRVRTLDLAPFNGEAVIDTRGLSCGAYLVEWRTRDGVHTGKVVVR